MTMTLARSAIAQPPLGPRRFFRSLWRDLPLWFLAYQGWTTFHLELKNLTPARPEFAWTVVFPLFWVVAFRWRCRGIPNARRLVRVTALVAAPLILLALAPSRPMTNAEIRPWFEASTLAWVGLLALHCATRRPVGDLVFFYAIGVPIGLILENGGILLGFFREPGYRLYLPPLLGPVATGLGWTTVFYTSMFLADHFTDAGAAPRPTVRIWERHTLRRRLARLADRLVRWPPFTATAVALSIDLQLDPAATAAGWWVWNPSLQPGFLGVPLVNYTAWLSATAPLFCLVWWLRRHPWPAWRVNLTLLVLLLPMFIVELTVVILLTIIAEGGWKTPSMRLFAAFFGPGLLLTLMGLGAALIALGLIQRLRELRHERMLHVAEVLRLATCARLLSACRRGARSDEALRLTLQRLFRDAVDPHQRFQETIGTCLEHGWIDGPPEARRVTESGRLLLDEFRSVVDR